MGSTRVPKLVPEYPRYYLGYSATTLGTRVLPWVLGYYLGYSGTTLGTRVLPCVLGNYLGYSGTTWHCGCAESRAKPPLRHGRGPAASTNCLSQSPASRRGAGGARKLSLTQPCVTAGAQRRPQTL